MEFDLPILALSQLRRPDKRDLSERPTMDSLLESGSWEADADTVVILNRPEFYKQGGRRERVMLYVDKNREGPTGRCELSATDKYFEFHPVETVDSSSREE